MNPRFILRVRAERVFAKVMGEAHALLHAFPSRLGYILRRSVSGPDRVSAEAAGLEYDALLRERCARLQTLRIRRERIERILGAI